MKLKSLLNKGNIYIFLWCIYYLQGTLYTESGIVSKSIFVVLMLLSIYNFYVANKKYKLPLYLKSLNLLLLMFTIYGSLLIFGIPSSPEEIVKHTYLQNIYISLLPIYSSYLYTRKGLITQQSLSWWIPIWLIVTTSSFFYYKEKELMDMLSNNTDITNNVGYTFLALMPTMMVLYKKQMLQYIGLLYCMIFILIGMKRGAIIIGVIVFMYFVCMSYNKVNRKQRKYILFFSICLIGIIAYLVMDMLVANDYFLLRIEQTMEGNTSSRDSIYEVLWSRWAEEVNLFYILLGRGANATVLLSGKYAHQDWLEILINQGIIGCILYLMYFVSLIKLYRSVRPISFVYLGVGMSFIIIFVKSLFSMSYGSMGIYLSLVLGFFVAYKQSYYNR